MSCNLDFFTDSFQRHTNWMRGVERPGRATRAVECGTPQPEFTLGDAAALLGAWLKVCTSAV